MSLIKKEVGVRWNCKFEKREFVGFIKGITKHTLTIKWLDHPYISESRIKKVEIEGPEYTIM